MRRTSKLFLWNGAISHDGVWRHRNFCTVWTATSLRTGGWETLLHSPLYKLNKIKNPWWIFYISMYLNPYKLAYSIWLSKTIRQLHGPSRGFIYLFMFRFLYCQLSACVSPWKNRVGHHEIPDAITRFTSMSDPSGIYLFSMELPAIFSFHLRGSYSFDGRMLIAIYIYIFYIFRYNVPLKCLCPFSFNGRIKYMHIVSWIHPLSF